MSTSYLKDNSRVLTASDGRQIISELLRASAGYSIGITLTFFGDGENTQARLDIVNDALRAAGLSEGIDYNLRRALKDDPNSSYYVDLINPDFYKKIDKTAAHAHCGAAHTAHRSGSSYAGR